MRDIRTLFALLLSLALVAGACGDDDEATDGPSVDAAVAAFCDTAQGYVTELDRYGRLFDDSAVTVGVVRTGGEALAATRDEVVAAADELRAAIEAADEAADDEASADGDAGDDPAADADVPSVSEESLDRLERADSELSEALADVDDDSPLADAAVEVTSAAFQLQVAWQIVLAEAGCLDDLDESLDALGEYVTALQTDLATLGFYDGPLDGVYGPATVAAVQALQADAGLPETGLVDRPTQAELAQRLADQESAQVTALQGLLAGVGYWDGPIDGVWTDELGGALASLQADLGLEPTGAIDAATLRALQEAVGEGLAAGGDGDDEAGDTTTTTTEATTTTTAPATTTTTTAPPPAEATTVVDVLAADGRFSTLLDAVAAAGLADVLAGESPVTVLAPTDDAFAALPPEVADQLTGDPDALRTVLLGHVIDGGGLLADLLVRIGSVPTADGGTVTVAEADGAVTIDGVARVVTADLLADNGVVHALDAVLLDGS